MTQDEMRDAAWDLEGDLEEAERIKKRLHKVMQSKRLSGFEAYEQAQRNYERAFLVWDYIRRHKHEFGY